MTFYERSDLTKKYNIYYTIYMCVVFKIYSVFGWYRCLLSATDDQTILTDI